MQRLNGFVDVKCAVFVWLTRSLQIPTLASQSSYDDSSWRQTAFSQSVALMSLLCPSVRSEGWLSLVCVGDHSTIGPSQAFLSLISCLQMAHATMPVSVVDVSPLESVLSRLLCLQSRASAGELPVFFLWECVGHLLIDWWKISGCSIQGVFVSVITVCSQTGACNFYTLPAIDLRVLSSFNSLFQAHRFQDISSFQNAVVQTFNIYL